MLEHSIASDTFDRRSRHAFLIILILFIGLLISMAQIRGITTWIFLFSALPFTFSPTLREVGLSPAAADFWSIVLTTLYAIIPMAAFVAADTRATAALAVFLAVLVALNIPGCASIAETVKSD